MAICKAEIVRRRKANQKRRIIIEGEAAPEVPATSIVEAQILPDITAVTFTLDQTSSVLDNGNGIWMAQPAVDGSWIIFTLNPVNIIRKRNLSTEFDLSTMSGTDDEASSESMDNVSFYDRAFMFSEAQQKLWCINYGNSRMYQYNYSTSNPVDLPANFTHDFLGNSITGGMDFSWGNDGTYLYIYDDGADKVNRYTCSTPYDISTCSTTVDASATGLISGARAFMMDNDGARFWLINSATIRQYAMSTPHDLSTTGTADTYVLTPSMSSVPCVCIVGDYMWSADSTSDAMRRWSWA